MQNWTIPAALLLYVSLNTTRKNDFYPTVMPHTIRLYGGVLQQKLLADWILMECSSVWKPIASMKMLRYA